MNKKIRLGLSLAFLCLTILVSAKDYTATMYGIKADGASLNTKAIQSLIDKVYAKGGGRIIFQPGRYLTGCLLLKSNVGLHFEKDAVLLGSTNPFHYYAVGNGSNSERKDNSNLALIVADKAQHISITGEGVIDAQGRALALNADSLYHAGLYADNNYNTRRNRPSELVRPKLLYFEQCSDIRIESVEMRNSACWGLSFDLCSQMVLKNLKVVNRAYWNNDGMDITDCKNVQITGCKVNSADDGICLKSYHVDSCNDSVYIADCEICSSSNAIKFGTASYGGFKNITIQNIKVFDTYRSAIAIESVDGANIENIQVNRIKAHNTGNAIFIRLGQRAGYRLGSIRNVTVKDLDVEVPFDRPDKYYDLSGPAVSFFHNPFPSSICGIPGNNIEGVRLENIRILCPGRSSRGMAYVPITRLSAVPEQVKEYPEFTMFGELPSWAFYVRHVKGLTLKNITLGLAEDDFRPAFVFDEAQDIVLSGCELPTNKTAGQYVLKNCTNYNLAPQEQIQEIR